MARRKLQQILLVSANDKTHPPFPGGWVLAIFDAVNAFAPEFAGKHRLPTSLRTNVRLKGGLPVKQSTHDEIEAKLAELVTMLFPTVSAINGFAAKYVNEYFRLWKDVATIATDWVKALGYEPELSGVLARSLMRDFVLRLCYLESCESALTGRHLSDVDLQVFRSDAPAEVYASLIMGRMHRENLSLESLAASMGLYEKKLRRTKKGEIGPNWRLLERLIVDSANKRLVAAIGFLDILLRNLGLNGDGMNGEILRVARIFLSSHLGSLAARDGMEQLARFAVKGDNLLLHPGFERLWPKMPDALWRAHLYSLQFARMVDISQAYLRFARMEKEGELRAFLDKAERKSDGCPHHWMEELQKQRNAF